MIEVRVPNDGLTPARHLFPGLLFVKNRLNKEVKIYFILRKPDYVNGCWRAVVWDFRERREEEMALSNRVQCVQGELLIHGYADEKSVRPPDIKGRMKGSEAWKALRARARALEVENYNLRTREGRETDVFLDRLLGWGAKLGFPDEVAGVEGLEERSLEFERLLIRRMADYRRREETVESLKGHLNKSNDNNRRQAVSILKMRDENERLRALVEKISSENERLRSKAREAAKKLSERTRS